MASMDETMLSQAAQDTHNIYILSLLLLILALVWSTRSRTTITSARKKLFKPNSLSFFSGVAMGILISQVPRLFMVPNAVSLRNQSEVATCKPCVQQADNSKPAHQSSENARSAIDGLPPGIMVSTTDLYPRRLWGRPEDDLPSRASNLLVITASTKHLKAVNKMVEKFRSKDWEIVLFHEDGKVDDWLEYDWTTHIVHVAAQGQSKWWFAKRFLHPDVVEPYNFVFLWDSNIDVSNFNPTEYLKLVKEHSLQISQPGIQPEDPSSLTWQMTKRRENSTVHRYSEEKPGWCKNPKQPPCAGFVEIQAPVFSRKAWRCTWHMVQNDLVHGWGLDFSLGRCAQGPAHEKVGVVDAEYIRQLKLPEGRIEKHLALQEKEVLEEILARSKYEWDIFKSRMGAAVKLQQKGMPEKESKVILTR